MTDNVQFLCLLIITQRCSIYRHEGHTKSKCTNVIVPKPNNPRGRQRLKPIGPFTEGVSLSQPLLYHAWPPLSQVETGSSSQLCEYLPSLSYALPRKRRGRPCKNHIDSVGTSSEAPLPNQQPIYDTGPRHIPMISHCF